MLGAFALGLGIEGYLNRHLPVWERILVGVSGILLIHPGLTTDLVGFFGLGVFGILGIIYRKHAPREDLPSVPM